MPTLPDALIDPLLRRWVFPLVKRGRTFAIPAQEADRRGLVESGEYPPEFLPFLERVLGTLAGPEWPPGSYYPGGWYRAMQEAGTDPGTAEPSVGALRPYFRDELRVDRRGGWWLGPKPIKGRVLKFFLRHLEYDPALGLYRVRYPLEAIEEIQYLHPESPPFRVVRIDAIEQPPLLHLNDGGTEPLRPETLWVDPQDRLYCRVRALDLQVEFDDPARWSILSTVEREGARWFVTIGAARFELPMKE